MSIVASHTTALLLWLSSQAHRRRVLTQWRSNPGAPLSLNMRCLLQAEIDAETERIAAEESGASESSTMARAKQRATNSVMQRFDIPSCAYKEPYLKELLEAGPEQLDSSSLCSEHVPQLTERILNAATQCKLPLPLQVLVPNVARKRNSMKLRCHCKQLESAPLVTNFGNGVAAISPELMLIQIAGILEENDLWSLATLCSQCFALYAPDPATPYGLLRRQPLTSPQHVLSTLNSLGRTPGRALLERALKLAVVNAAAPSELCSALFANAPRSKGGYGYISATCNVVIPTTQSGMRRNNSYRICDVYFPKARVAIECKGAKAHAGARQLVEDSERETELRAAGIEPLTLTSSQLRDFSKCEQFMIGALGKKLGSCRIKELEMYKDRRINMHRQVLDVLLTNHWHRLAERESAGMLHYRR